MSSVRQREFFGNFYIEQRSCNTSRAWNQNQNRNQNQNFFDFFGPELESESELELVKNYKLILVPNMVDF